MNLLNNLKHRYEVAKRFTDNFHEQIKTAIKDYNAENNDYVRLLEKDKVVTTKGRYRFVYPLVFTNQEAMLASMFDRAPDLIFDAKGEKDEGKQDIVEAVYRYLVDKLDLEWFMNESAWWFILTGMCVAHGGHDVETEEVPIMDEETGEPIFDELGEPVTRTVYTKDDPYVRVDDLEKIVWSPESEFSIRGDKVPYYVRTELMEIDEVEETYGVRVEPDSSIKVEGTDVKAEETDGGKVSDFDRVKVHFYYGRVSSENSSEVEDWEYGSEYYIVFTDKKMLHSEKVDEKNCRLGKWYGAPNKFFGFGIGKLLHPFQKEKSTRRSQQMRYADVLAFPKIAIDSTGKYDEKAILDPRENVVMLYDEKKPEYMSPPQMSDSIIKAEQSVDQDAQQVSGLLDLSGGSQTSTVDTATGQTIFAEAAERRMRLAKKKFVSFYREVVIMLLKDAQQNWKSEKVLSITDDMGNDKVMNITADSLSDIDFDTDIDIDPETLSVNKDVLRQQAIDLYDRTKDDPIIDRRAVVSDMMRIGFNQNNPDKYLKPQGLEPGTMLVDPYNETMYEVGEDGELVNVDEQQQLAEPTGGNNEIPKSPSGVMGGAINV